MKSWVFLAAAFFSLSLFGVSAEKIGLWQTNWSEAQKAAAKEGKPILLLLTGSDWCPWCEEIEDRIFSQKQFQEFAEKELILVVADFPRKIEQAKVLKEQNEELKKQYLNDGYPTVWLLDAGGKKLSPDMAEVEMPVDDWLKKLSEHMPKKE